MRRDRLFRKLLVFGKQFGSDQNIGYIGREEFEDNKTFKVI